MSVVPTRVYPVCAPHSTCYARLGRKMATLPQKSCGSWSKTHTEAREHVRCRCENCRSVRTLDQWLKLSDLRFNGNVGSGGSLRSRHSRWLPDRVDFRSRPHAAGAAATVGERRPTNRVILKQISTYCHSDGGRVIPLGWPGPHFATVPPNSDGSANLRRCHRGSTRMLPRLQKNPAHGGV